MPFKSEKQRRFMWLKHPDIAKRWADKYPTKKDLPMYVDSKDGEKQSTAAQILNAVLPNYLRKCANSVPTRTYDANTKESDSKQEYVKLPVQHGPTFAGQSEAQAVERPVEDGLNDKRPSSAEKQDELTADALFKKLSVVLSPVLMQEIENEQAQQQAREAQRMPQNAGIKQMPPAVNSIMPPMGMAQPAPNPGQTQPAQPAQPQQPANGQLASVGGGNSPNANPINAFGGLSTTGDINGNAALGTQNSAGGEKLGAGNDTLAWLMSMGTSMTLDPDDLDLDERAKQAGSPAWQRSAGKNDEGGLNAKGRASYNKATGGHLKAPVTEKNPTGKAKARRHSFCSRMCGMKKHETGAKTKSDPDSRINKALRKWNCKCSSDKQAEFDPNMSHDAENAIMHGTGLIGSGAVGTVAGLPVSAGIEGLMRSNQLLPDQDKHPVRHILAQSLIRAPMIAGGMLGMRMYDNYIMRPHMRREEERKKKEMLAALNSGMQKQFAAKQANDPSLERVLSTALVSAGGGLALGAYPGLKLQQASERAGNSELTNFVAGKAPIAVGSAVSAGLYNYLRDRAEGKKKSKKQPAQPASAASYLQYLVH